MQKFRVFFNKIVQQASGETGEVEIVRSKFAKWQNLFKPIFCATMVKSKTFANQTGRLKRVSISQWVKLKQVSVQQVKRTRGQTPKPLQTKQAETSFDKPMGEVKTSFCSASEANKGANSQTFANQTGRLKQVLISQWVKLKQVSVQQAKRTRGEVQNLCQPNRQAETSFDKPMVKLKQLPVCKRSEQGANSQTFASKLARAVHSFDPMVRRLLIF